MSSYNLSLKLRQFNIQISIHRLQPCQKKLKDQLVRLYQREKTMAAAERQWDHLRNSIYLSNTPR